MGEIKKTPVNTLGGFIRAKRVEKGWSMERLAREVQVSMPFIQKLERGGIDPSFTTVAEIARKLSVGLDEIPTRVGKKPEPKG